MRLFRCLLTALLAAAAFTVSAADKPNIVFILADDLGWRDTSLYGSKFYQTPNIDRLAARGMMFTQAYAAAPICSPTRASIMTGLWPARVGITSPVCHQPEENLEDLLQDRARPWEKAMVRVHSMSSNARSWDISRTAPG